MTTEFSPGRTEQDSSAEARCTPGVYTAGRPVSSLTVHLLLVNSPPQPWSSEQKETQLWLLPGFSQDQTCVGDVGHSENRGPRPGKGHRWHGGHRGEAWRRSTGLPTSRGRQGP